MKAIQHTALLLQDRGEAPPDPVYGKVLAALHLVSCYAAIPLLDALLTWRKESLKAAARAPELVVLRKRVSQYVASIFGVMSLDQAMHRLKVSQLFLYNSSLATLVTHVLLHQQVLRRSRWGCGQLAVETVFLEATLQLVAPESSPLSDGQANAVEILVFDWVLHAEKFVDSKHSELLKARERVGFCMSFNLHARMPAHEPGDSLLMTSH